MDWSQRKQLKYFFIILVIVVLVVAWIVWKLFFNIEPTCFDRKHNGDERGVDCGGSCVLVCMPDVVPPVVLWSVATRVTDDVYNVVAYIDNQNVSSGVEEIPYEFKVYDENNILLTERRGQTFLGPNQRTAIFESGLKVGNRQPSFTQFEFLAPPTWVRTEERFSRKLIVVEKAQMSQLDTRPAVKARVRNNNTFDLRDITFVAIVYDGRGNALGTSKTVVDMFPQGDFKDISFTWPTPFEGDPVRTEIVPRVFPFDQPEY